MAQPLTEYERHTITPIERERFRVDDDSKATWAMRKLRAIESKIQENEQIADDERARINEWLEISNKSLEDDADYFRSLLIDYARQQRDTDNRKSISTPYGTVKSRAGQRK